jgi:arylsulfatase A
VMQAVRRGNWKAVRSGLAGPIELFDLKNDVAESRNVADANPEIVADFKRYLATARVPSPHWPDQP